MNKLRERFKGAIAGALFVLVLLSSVPVLARVARETITVDFNNISVAVNGQIIELENEPFIYNGRTYLPVRDVARAVGFEVTWEDATNTVHLTGLSNAAAVTPDYPAHQAQTPAATQIAQPSVTAPHTAQGQSARGARPTNPAISLEGAVQIAAEDLRNRGIDASLRSNSGMSWERNQWVWELEFRPTTGRAVIEYYINVDTGAIVKFEWDR